MYLSPGTWVRFPRKAKTPIVKGVEEDREVAVPGSPKARAVTHMASIIPFFYMSHWPIYPSHHSSFIMHSFFVIMSCKCSIGDMHGIIQWCKQPSQPTKCPSSFGAHSPSPSI
ncbi:hypothetical protein QL285_093708 [Trifolium repens]|nr:hypothetical protein QL285_093708 [Trifolium repens]